MVSRQGTLSAASNQCYQKQACILDDRYMKLDQLKDGLLQLVLLPNHSYCFLSQNSHVCSRTCPAIVMAGRLRHAELGKMRPKQSARGCMVKEQIQISVKNTMGCELVCCTVSTPGFRQHQFFEWTTTHPACIVHQHSAQRSAPQHSCFPESFDDRLTAQQSSE